MPQIIRSRESEEDVAEIAAFIAQDDLAAALRLIDTFDHKLKMLAEFPGLGQKRDDLLPGIRSLPVGNYLLFYRRAKNGIELVRVLHGARNLRRIFSRLKKDL